MSGPTFAAPFGVGLDCHVAASVIVRIVNIEFERPLLVRFDQRVQIFALVQYRVGADDVVGERAETGFLGRRRRMHVQNVPHILVGALERAESYRNAEQALAAPLVVGRQLNVAHGLRFAAVHRHANRLADILPEQLFQRVVVLVEANLLDRYDEIEERLQAARLCRRIVLYLHGVRAQAHSICERVAQAQCTSQFIGGRRNRQRATCMHTANRFR